MLTHRRTFGSNNGSSSNSNSNRKDNTTSSDGDALRRITAFRPFNPFKSFGSIILKTIIAMIVAATAFALPGSVPVTA